MRVGKNPAKAILEVTQPAKVTVATVVYIPALSGYFRDSLDVLKLCLGSIVKNTKMDYDLMVFDNASCPEVREYLLEMHAAGKIDYLVFSEKNIGKSGAWNYLFGAALGEFIAFTDSDVYHYEGWLTALMDAMELFPNAGMITGAPLKTHRRLLSATTEWAREQGILEENVDFSWELYWKHYQDLGRTLEYGKEFFEENPSHAINLDGKRFYVGASHFQFLTQKKIVQQFLPLPSDRPLNQDIVLDEELNAHGYLRICLDQWYVQHMGNSVPEKGKLLEDDLLALVTDGKQKKLKKVGSGRKTFWDISYVRKVLHWAYDRIFEILYRN